MRAAVQRVRAEPFQPEQAPLPVQHRSGRPARSCDAELAEHTQSESVEYQYAHNALRQIVG